MNLTVSSFATTKVETAAAPLDRQTVTFLAANYSTPTIYYGATPNVSAASHDGTLSPGDSLTLDRQAKWFVAAPTASGSPASGQIAVSPPAEQQVASVFVRNAGGTDLQASSDHGSTWVDIGSPGLVSVTDFGPLVSGDTSTPARTTNTATFQAAITAVAGGGTPANNTARGRRLLVPPGDYALNGTLTIPDFWGFHFQGSGREATVLRWNNQGANQYAISMGQPANGFARYITDMRLIGVNAGGTLTGGTQGMNGVVLTSQAHMERVYIEGFYAGVAFSGDHQTLLNCRLASNYYGAYWAPGAPVTGNQWLRTTVFDSNTGACCAVAGDAVIDVCGFDSCHFSACPTAFYREAVIAPNIYRGTWLQDTTLANCDFEGIGNAMFYNNDGQVNSQSTDVTFHNCRSQDYTEPSFRSAVIGHDYTVFTAGGIFQWRTIGGSLFRYPGALGIFSCPNFSTSHFEEMADMASTLNGTSQKFLNGGCSTITGGPAGQYRIGKAGATIAQFDWLQHSASTQEGIVKGTSTGLPMGVAQIGGSVNDFVIYKNRGRTNVNAAAAVTTGKYVKPDVANAGGVVEATGWTDGPIVGRAAPGSGAGPTTEIYVGVSG